MKDGRIGKGGNVQILWLALLFWALTAFAFGVQAPKRQSKKKKNSTTVQTVNFV